MLDSLSFIAALHRRMLLRTLVDRSGLILLSTSLAAVLILPLKIWGGLTFGITFVVISIVTVFVAVWQLFRRWPGAAEAAALADTQLGLDDLLTTVSNLQPVPFDDLSAVVKAIADKRCRDIHLSDVKIPRMPLRMWSGIALLSAVAVTLAVVPIHGSYQQQVEPNLSMLGRDADPSTANDSEHSVAIASRSGRDPMGNDETQITTSTESEVRPGQTSNRPADSHRSASGGQPGIGTGASTSDTYASANRPERSASTVGTSSSGGVNSGGGIESIGARLGTDTISEMTTGQSPAQDRIPAWQSNDWAPARTAAMSSLDSGSIPAGCRDLVRDYFR